MTINKMQVFGSRADKNMDGLNAEEGFPLAEKPARQWFNWLFYAQTSKTNEVIDLANSNFKRVVNAELIYEQLKRDVTSQLQATSLDLQDVRDYADQLMQTAVGGKLAYKTYAAMVADKANITANSSIDIIADTDDKNGTYLYDGTNFVKSQYDLEKVIRAKVQNTFGTYARMVASNLSDGSYALVADDTANNGLYVKTAGAWVKSGYNIDTLIKDELPKHVSYTTDWYKAHPPEASLWEDVTIISGLYIHTASSQVQPSASTSLAYMPVTAGKAYLLPTSSNDLAACFINSPEDIKAGATLRQARLKGYHSGDPLSNKQMAVIPAGVKYLAFNAKVLAFNFTQGAGIYEVDYFIAGLLGRDIGDKKLRDSIDRMITTNETYPNLASAARAVILDNRYVNVSVDTAGSSPGTRLEVVPVENGEVYTIYTPNTMPTVWGIWDSGSINPTGTLTPYYSQSALGKATPNCKVLGGGLFQLTIPETSGGFICFNTIIPSQKYSHSGDIIVVKGAYDFVPRSTIDKLFGLEVKDSFARKELSKLTGDIQVNSPLSGKTWVAIGDSITEKNYRANRNYHDFVKDKVPDLTVYNLGRSGTGFFSRPNVASEVNASNPDVITVFFGTNDYNHGNKPLGDFLDTGTGTISGCINTCITGLMTKFPAAKFAMITPLPRGTSYGLNGANNNQGYSLYELSQLIIKYAKHYGLPSLDLYTKSNLPVWTDAGNQLFFKAPSLETGDKLHPNDLGQQRMAEIIKPFLESF